MITLFEFTIIMIVQILVLALVKTLYQDYQYKKDKKTKKNSW